MNLLGGVTMGEQEVGKVTHYFGNIGVAVVKLSGVLKKGDSIHIKGATSDISQKALEMQIGHKPVAEAKKGQEIGMKVDAHVREHDTVFKVMA